MKIIWNQVTWYSKLIAFILVFVVFFIGLFLGKESSKIQKNNLQEIPKGIPVINDKDKEVVSMCYLHKGKMINYIYDKAWLKMYIVDDKVFGEYHNLPAQKDSKTGPFEGVVGKLNQENMSRMANVLWIASAEGMTDKEELLIEFGDGSAVVLFGAMVKRFDGVYEYEDKTKVMPSFLMSQINCNSLDEMLIVENYIRENIKNIATNEPVLGGSWWYARIPEINTNTKEGLVVYEDGHIESKARFKYDFDPKTGGILITDFIVQED